MGHGFPKMVRSDLGCRYQISDLSREGAVPDRLGTVDSSFVVSCRSASENRYDELFGCWMWLCRASGCSKVDCKRRSSFALTRSVSRIDELSDAGLEPVVADWYDQQTMLETAARLPAMDYLFVGVSHAAVPGLSHEQTHIRGLENLRPVLEQAGRLVYISTTGVYQHCDDGRWVNRRITRKSNTSRIDRSVRCRAVATVACSAREARHPSCSWNLWAGANPKD